MAVGAMPPTAKAEEVARLTPLRPSPALSKRWIHSAVKSRVVLGEATYLAVTPRRPSCAVCSWAAKLAGKDPPVSV